MSNILKFVDAQLNRYTMYRGLLMGLGGLLAISVVLAYSGLIGISGTGLIVSVLLLVVSCYVANYALGQLFGAARNTDSWLITALILACILPQATTVSKGLYILLAGLLAMASKYLLVFRGSHIFNPAATGAFVLSVAGLLPATWWIATPWLLPFTILLALTTLRKQRLFPMFVVFALAAAVMSVYVGVILHGGDTGSVLRNAFVSLPLIFMGSVMLTEPSTLAPTRYYQLLTGALVGVIYASQLHLGRLSSTPEAALMVAGLFTVLAAPAYGAIVRLKRITQLSPQQYDLAFEKPAGLAFKPGQYLQWTLPHAHADFRGNRRAFSIASAPAETDLHIGIRTYEPGSSFKQALVGLKPGMRIRLASVAGSFTLRDDTVPLLLIAGGIGITPFRSMLQHLVETQRERDIVLVYSAASANDFVYKETIEAAKAYGLQAHLITERLTPEALHKLVPELTNRYAYLSGPPGMVDSYRTMLRKLGVSRRQIKADHFSGY